MIYKFLNSSIGRKILMSLTGFFLIVFLLTHLLVNLSLFLGEEAFNAACHFMSTNPVIQLMQYVLASGFIIHIILGIVLTIRNNWSKPIRYGYNPYFKNYSWSSRNMLFTGLTVMLFIMIHMKDYFYPMKFGKMNGMTDYELVVSLFKNPVYVLIYVTAFVMLGLHLNHGFQSAFQSVGLNHKKYTPVLKFLGKVYSIFITLGFSSISIYFFFN
ncbi:succinate dehydrogenase cytochrome b subunit [Ichthyobacterium seriolicida]|uniref:Succinate dehydrogenase cytochrome b subunit n=1 Tax=Ichthyobacterium seriolicida TaxID=242600 RepID=A0A1J1E333_9FLAO|nr:succinate dehydrogenase cytochrome b subunit [Ichthyobacterium seriolicida]BAV94444.1 succinate dehydrogenase cytochrome b subunit [Ichthyobacterium seriolicida]